MTPEIAVPGSLGTGMFTAVVPPEGRDALPEGEAAEVKEVQEVEEEEEEESELLHENIRADEEA